MSSLTLDDFLLQLKKGEKIHLASDFTSNSIEVHYLLGIGFPLAGAFFYFIIAFAGPGSDSNTAGFVLLALFCFFGGIFFVIGLNKSEAVIKGEMIYFKSLMLGVRYEVRLEDISDISLVPHKTGYGFSAIIGESMNIMKTTVTFQYGNKQKALVLFNTKNWPYGREISVADVIWTARDEAYLKSEEQ